uniref:Uncharacterized protein n=1 Tax=Monodelphis domestica TaxID=13616 RepID=A0A5F8GZT4_MONDO
LLLLFSSPFLSSLSLSLSLSPELGIKCEFYNMIRCTIFKNCLLKDDGNYGCYCVLGGFGTTMDSNSQKLLLSHEQLEELHLEGTVTNCKG